eukprot:600967-Hanusia_phi.AAC.1
MEEPGPPGPATTGAHRHPRIRDSQQATGAPKSDPGRIHFRAASQAGVTVNRALRHLGLIIVTRSLKAVPPWLPDSVNLTPP